MKIMKKTYLIGAILFLMLCLNVAHAGPIIQQSGKLIDVEETGRSFGCPQKFEVILTMEINGVTIYLTMWVPWDEIDDLIEAKGRMITICYHWDGNGRRIFDAFYLDSLNGIQSPSIPIPDYLKHRHGEAYAPVLDPNW